MFQFNLLIEMDIALRICFSDLRMFEKRNVLNPIHHYYTAQFLYVHMLFFVVVHEKDFILKCFFLKNLYKAFFNQGHQRQQLGKKCQASSRFTTLTKIKLFFYNEWFKDTIVTFKCLAIKLIIENQHGLKTEEWFFFTENSFFKKR